MKYLLLVFLLVSCTTKQSIDSPEEIITINEPSIREELRKLDYYIKHDKCFTNYAICLGEKKKECWAKHEACVIAVYKEWMRFK